VKREIVVGTVLVVVVCYVVGYASYRIARQYVFPSASHTPSAFVSACPARATSLRVFARPVVTFGDSITEGYGATNNCMPPDVRPIVPASMHLVRATDTSYPGDLARLIHGPVLNYGVDDETTIEGLARLRRLLRTIHASSVILLEGTNDLMSGQQPLTVAYRLLRMATLIRESGARPILLTVLPTDRPQWAPLARRVAVLNGLLRAGARADHLTVVDSAATFAAHKPLAAFFRHHDGREDGFHPNDTGYRVLAVLVYQALGHT
jgi:lysophospholipase L1-like esterase